MIYIIQIGCIKVTINKKISAQASNVSDIGTTEIAVSVSDTITEEVIKTKESAVKLKEGISVFK